MQRGPGVKIEDGWVQRRPRFPQDPHYFEQPCVHVALLLGTTPRSRRVEGRRGPEIRGSNRDSWQSAPIPVCYAVLQCFIYDAYVFFF